MQKEGAKGESNPRPLAPKARIIPLDHWPFADAQKVRRPGIEPGPPAWKADILPLNYRRFCINYLKKVIDPRS